MQLPQDTHQHILSVDVACDTFCCLSVRSCQGSRQTLGSVTATFFEGVLLRNEGCIYKQSATLGFSLDVHLWCRLFTCLLMT